MLKITSIVSSLIFLLFVGSGSYARTFAKQDQQQKTDASAEATVKEEAKGKQDKEEESSEENEVDGKPFETVVQLDVFQAISLVNAQLRWKDYHAENSRQARSFFSKKQNLEVGQSEDVTEFFNLQSVALGLPEIEQTFIFSIWPTMAAPISDIEGSRNAQDLTIAFILNCGTYPHLQS